MSRARPSPLVSFAGVAVARNSNVSFVHLTRENLVIKNYAESPETANRWCILRGGKPFQPRLVNREANPHRIADLGSLRECRFALMMLPHLQPPIEALAVFQPDGDMLVFPVNPEIPLTGKSQESPADAPDISSVGNHCQVPNDAPEGNSAPSSGDVEGVARD